MSSLSNGVKITTTKTSKIESTGGTIPAVSFKKFGESIPDTANISVYLSKAYPGEFGFDTWSLTATWNE